jgi:5-methylcytosine-specific restriction endonuclease McrA
LNAQFFVRPDGVALRKEKKHIPTAIRKAVFERDNSRCVGCGSEVLRFEPKFWLTHAEWSLHAGHVDHIVPRSRGGQTVMSNLRLLCQYCNLSKCAD